MIKGDSNDNSGRSYLLTEGIVLVSVKITRMKKIYISFNKTAVSPCIFGIISRTKNTLA